MAEDESSFKNGIGSNKKKNINVPILLETQKKIRVLIMETKINIFW